MYTVPATYESELVAGSTAHSILRIGHLLDMRKSVVLTVTVPIQERIHFSARAKSSHFQPEASNRIAQLQLQVTCENESSLRNIMTSCRTRSRKYFILTSRWFLGILSAFLVINDLNSHQGNIRSADPKIESILNKSDFWSFYEPISMIFMRFSLVLTNKTWQTHFSSELNK